MSFVAFRSAGAPYKAPQRRVGDVEGSLQARLDFTPSASELAHAIRGRESKAQAILEELRRGPASTSTLARIGGVRFGARICELRQRGFKIVTEGRADYAIYRLGGE